MDMEEYWTLWARYWAYVEDIFLDIDVINKLAGSVESPVLIVGAGQGVLVEQLQKRRFKVDGVDLNPHMVAGAKERRGIDLVEADASDMPFADGSYKTTIIATGVIDLMEDEEKTLSIIREAKRVTDDTGQVLAAFYRYHPGVEELFRRSGLITDDGVMCFRRVNEMAKLSCDSPLRYLRAFKRDANVGYCSALFTLIKVLLFLPKKEKNVRKRFVKLWKRANRELEDPAALLTCIPESVPYRNEAGIRDLLQRLDVSIHKTTMFDSCIVVQI